MNDLLPLRCLQFVQDQSAGEWGEQIEREDAAKLLAFVRAEIAYANQNFPTSETDQLGGVGVRADTRRGLGITAASLTTTGALSEQAATSSVRRAIRRSIIWI